jgi:hypothetical protein
MTAAEYRELAEELDRLAAACVGDGLHYVGQMMSLASHALRVAARGAAPEGETLTPTQAMERMPWISGRLFVDDPEKLHGLFREVVDALWYNAPVTLVSDLARLGLEEETP